jgi:hypothetical protein
MTVAGSLAVLASRGRSFNPAGSIFQDLPLSSPARMHNRQDRQKRRKRINPQGFAALWPKG